MEVIYKKFNQSETILVKQCMAYLDQIEITNFKHDNVPVRRYINRVKKGVPDIIAILPPHGKFVGIECKTKKGIQSDSQKQFEIDSVSDGAIYLVIRDIMELVNYFKSFNQSMT